jgi:hypothetical protein
MSIRPIRLVSTRDEVVHSLVINSDPGEQREQARLDTVGA